MTVTDPSSFDDAYIPLAFSMHSTPGAYAVLAGAGVSFGSVKTAWDIVVELAQRLCRISDPATADTLDHANVEAWFERTQGERLTYGGLLAKVAPLPNERGAVLTKFFEQEGPDGLPQLPTPTAAHRAVARLVAAGTVRVIVTMNFDHLFEAALHEVGIEPHVISTESGAEGRQPLHTMTCCVVHLHGSYRDASSMLNTDTELGSYKPQMQTLLDEIVRAHGLLIAGWSAQWDQALRDTIVREHRAFYTPAWIDPRPLKTDAQNVATAIGATTIEATADAAFTRLADAVATMDARDARDPLTARVVIDRIKRDLAGDHPAITAHDTFTAELGRIEELPQFSELLVGDDYDERLTKIDEASRVPAAATAVLARWGNAETDEWWLAELDQWSRAVDPGHFAQGRGKYLDLPLLVGTRLFYAAGIACVAGRRHDLIARLFQLPVAANWKQSGPAHNMLAWDVRHLNTKRAVTNPLRAELEIILADALGVSRTRIGELWQEFETLRTAVTILTASTLDQRNAVVEADNRFQDALNQATGSDRRAVRDAWIEVDRKLSDMARLNQPSVGRPHIQVSMDTSDPTMPRWVSRVAERLSESKTHPALTAITNQTAAVQLALRAAGQSFAMTAAAIAAPLAMSGQHDGTSDLWLDTPESK